MIVSRGPTEGGGTEIEIRVSSISRTLSWSVASGLLDDAKSTAGPHRQITREITRESPGGAKLAPRQGIR
jgi:hypothetical protein